MAKMTQQQLETHLWGAAKILRGKTAGQDYKTYILTLMFFKRLSDQWDYEAEEIISQQEKETGIKLNEAQRPENKPNVYSWPMFRGQSCKDQNGDITF